MVQAGNDNIVVEVNTKQIEKALNNMSTKLDDILKKHSQGLNQYSSKSIVELEKSKKRVLDYDHKLKTDRRSGEVMSRVGGMFGGGAGLGGVTNLIQGFAMMRRADTIRAQKLTGTKDPAQQAELAQLQKFGAGSSVFDKFFDKFDQMFGEGSKFDSMFKGHGKEVAGGLGVLGIAGGAALGKAIIDSSPAFQQLLKIMNFGFMLILRPIGDFFAFLFRPILILLLRKFIIPFYQTVYPWFLKASRVGEDIADLTDKVTDVLPKAIETSVKTSMASVGTTIANALTPKGAEKVDDVIKALPEPKIPANPPEVKALPEPEFAKNQREIKQLFEEKVVKSQSPIGRKEAIGGLSKSAEKIVSANKGLALSPKVLKGLKIADKVVNAPATLAGKAIKGTAKIGANIGSKLIGTTATNALKTATKPATTAIAKIGATTAGKMATKAIPILGQALLGIDVAGSALKAANPELYGNIREGARSIFEPLIGKDAFEFGSDFLGWGEQSTAEQLLGLGQMGVDALANAATPKANNLANSRSRTKANYAGGVINEPIFGIGKSGQKYTFGERGAEVVIPKSKLGRSGGDSAPIVINVTVNGNIMSERDMLNFQRTIMKAVETSNTRRAKL